MPQKPSQASQAYSDSHAYIPPHVQEAMAKQMEHMSPSHMKQYAGAFVQQNMAQGRGAPTPGKVSGPPAGYRPITHLPRKDHFHQFKVQQPSRADNFIQNGQTPGDQIQPDMSAQQPAAPMPQQSSYPAAADPQYQPQPQPTASPQPTAQVYPQQTPGPQPNTMPDYDFFMNTQPPAPKSFQLPGSSSSAPVRIGILAGGFIVLLILFNIVKGLLSGPSNFPYYMSVIQDQQEITHLATAGLAEPSLSTAHKNFAATAQLSVKSSQSDLVKLVVGSGKKIDDKQANLKISTTTDTQLTSAAASGNYNPTFNQAMQTQLDTYKKDIDTVFSKTTNPKNRDLLKDQYKQAELLSQELASASTTPTE